MSGANSGATIKNFDGARLCPKECVCVGKQKIPTSAGR